MARQKGTLILESNTEPVVKAPLDARTVVDTLADLTVASNFTYAYEGLSVYVKEVKKAYRLIDRDVTKSENWKEEGSGGGQIDVDTALSETSTNPVQNKAITVEVVNIQSAIATIEAAQALAAGSIADLQTSVGQLQTSVAKLEMDSASAQSAITAIEAALERLDREKAAQSSIVAVQSSIDVLDAVTLRLDWETQRLDREKAAQSSIVAVQSSIDVLDAALVRLDQEKAAQSSITAIEAALDRLDREKAAQSSITTIQSSITIIQSSITTVQTALDTKVDKVEGKGLSTEDYTAEDQDKLTALAEIKSIGAGLNLNSEGVLSVEDPSEGVTYTFDYVKKPEDNKWYTTLSDGTTTQELAVPPEWYQGGGGGGSVADLFDYAVTTPVDMEGAHDIAAFMSRYLNLPGMATGIGTSRLGYKVPTVTTGAYTWSEPDANNEQTATADVTITFADGSTLVKTLEFKTTKNRWVNAAKGVGGGYIDTGLTLDYGYTLFYEGYQPAGASGAPIGAFASTEVRTTARLMGNANKMQCMWPGNKELTSTATGINFNESHMAVFNANVVELTQGGTTYTGALTGTSSGTDSAHILIFNEEASSAQRNAIVQKAGVRSGADTLREIVMAEINGEIVGVDIANLTQTEQDEIISEAYSSVNASRIYKPVVGTLEEVTV